MEWFELEEQKEGPSGDDVLTTHETREYWWWMDGWVKFWIGLKPRGWVKHVVPTESWSMMTLYSGCCIATSIVTVTSCWHFLSVGDILRSVRASTSIIESWSQGENWWIHRLMKKGLWSERKWRLWWSFSIPIDFGDSCEQTVQEFPMFSDLIITLLTMSHKLLA